MTPTPAETPGVAFVLGGGGRWGAVEVGMLQALDAAGVSADVVLGASTIYVLQVGRVEQRLDPPTRLHQAAVVAFEISRRHRFSTALQHLPDGVAVHLLPSANEIDPTDRRQLQWSDFGRTAELIERARDATAGYLAQLG